MTQRNVFCTHRDTTTSACCKESSATKGHVAAACPHSGPRVWPPQDNPAQPTATEGDSIGSCGQTEELLAVSPVNSGKGNQFLTQSPQGHLFDSCPPKYLASSAGRGL